MKKLFQEFVAPAISTWKTLLAKELQTDNITDPSSFEYPIEELNFQNIYDNERSITSNIDRTSNDWLIGVEIPVIHSQKANSKALHLLNTGANSLHFILENTTELDLETLLNKIEVTYVHCTFTVRNNEQASQITKWFRAKSPLHLQINTPAIEINAYEIFSLGANAAQELAYALAKGKTILADNTSTSTSFMFGIGDNFLIEIAKFRAFQQLWDRLTNAYEATVKTTVIAKTGFTNKSLQDPYTNILRQTTEALSAVTGGVDVLIVQPYDLHSENGSSEFTERMALNISLILKEESEINQLVDPFAGSIILEKFTNTLCDAAWSTFQKLEALGGYTSEKAMIYLKDEILRIREKRIVEISTKKRTVIGINKYFNPELPNLHWKKEIGTYLGLNHFILEQALKNRNVTH